MYSVFGHPKFKNGYMHINVYGLKNICHTHKVINSAIGCSQKPSLSGDPRQSLILSTQNTKTQPGI